MIASFIRSHLAPLTPKERLTTCRMGENGCSLMPSKTFGGMAEGAETVLHFPCEKLFDTFDWQNGYLQYWKFDPAKTELFMRFQAEVLQRFQSYQIPVIKLKKAVKKEAVCHVFEKVNTGGVVLNAFELLTATYAAENFRLRDDWYGSVERKVAGAQPAMVVKKVLRGVQNTDFLQAITLINTYRRRQEDVQAKKPNDETTGRQLQAQRRSGFASG